MALWPLHTPPPQHPGDSLQNLTTLEQLLEASAQGQRDSQRCGLVCTTQISGCLCPLRKIAQRCKVALALAISPSPATPPPPSQASNFPLMLDRLQEAGSCFCWAAQPQGYVSRLLVTRKRQRRLVLANAVGKVQRLTTERREMSLTI